MARMRRWTIAALVLVLGLGSARTATAGPVLDWLCGDCPRPSYSPFRYWTPALARLHDWFHGPAIPVEPPDRHPEIPPTFAIRKYPCPSAAPATTIIEPPTPPAESRFRY